MTRLNVNPIKVEFRNSRGGWLAAGSYLLLVFGVFAWIFFVASKNPADSGESGLWLLPLAMPWISLVPTEWLSLWFAIGCFLLNATILYCVFGGLRIVGSAGEKRP